MKLLEAVAVPVFAAIGVWALLVSTADGALAVYGRGIASLVLAAILWASLAWRPFTEQYARESVPQLYWESLAAGQRERLHHQPGQNRRRVPCSRRSGCCIRPSPGLRRTSHGVILTPVTPWLRRVAPAWRNPP